MNLSYDIKTSHELSTVNESASPLVPYLCHLHMEHPGFLSKIENRNEGDVNSWPSHPHLVLNIQIWSFFAALVKSGTDAGWGDFDCKLLSHLSIRFSVGLSQRQGSMQDTWVLPLQPWQTMEFILYTEAMACWNRFEPLSSSEEKM